MESESKIGTNSLLCPLIASWVTLPSSAFYIVSLYFILRIPDILLYILAILFVISFPTNAILITISYNTNILKLYYISYYISLIFVILFSIFFLGFFIGCFIYIGTHLKEINVFSFFLKTIAIIIPFGLLFSMLLNIVSFKKNDNENTNMNINDSQIKENKVEIVSII